MNSFFAGIFSVLVSVVSSNQISNEFFLNATGDFLKEADRAILYSAKRFDLNHPERNYELYLTKELVDAIRAEDASLKSRNCDGTEDLGTMCGLNFNPITCNNSYSNIYFYKTHADDENVVEILASLNELGDNPTMYKLVHTPRGWLVDAIECSNGTYFNY